MSGFKQLMQEIHRRSLWQVLAIYVAASWVVLEAADVLVERLSLPEWVYGVAIVLLLVGLPIVLATAFVQEGISPTRRHDPTLMPGGEPGPEAMPLEVGGARRLFTWRNAIMGGLLALSLWGVVATAWLLFGDKADRGIVEAAVERKSVAVLPFVNMSADPENEYFSDGITDAIITHLTKIADLRVTSRTSTMQYKGSNESLRAIAEELGVATIVEGGVQRTEDRVRINAQLINAQADQHLWAEIYDRDLTDIFAIQSDVAQRIATALQATLTPDEEERISTPPTENLVAYNLYLQGRYFWNRRTEPGFRRAIEFFEQAIEEDASYALAHAGLADSYNLLAGYGHLAPLEANQRAKAAALYALEIDSTLAEAHTAIGSIKTDVNYNIAGARASYQRAIELNPSYATAFQWYANTFREMGEFEEALELMTRAVELDPLSLIINRALGRVFIVGRKYDRAIEQLRKTLEMDSQFVPALTSLGRTYLFKKRYDDAIAEFQTAIELTDSAPSVLAELGYAYAVSGREAEARRVLDRLLTLSEKRYVDPVGIATLYVGLGDKDQAFHWLNMAYEGRAPTLDEVKAWPMYDGLRSDPRYDELLKKMGLD